MFGALEARRNFLIASRQEALVRNDDAARATVRLDDLVRASSQQAAIVATRREVHDVGPTCASSMRGALQVEPGYAAFARTNAAGRVTCSSSPLPKSVDLSSGDWFSALKAGAARATSNLMPTAFSDEPSLIVAVPVRDGAQFDGAMLVVMSKSMLQRAIASELGDDVGAIVAFDRRGALLTAAARDVEVSAATDTAALALASSKGSSTANGLYAERIAAPGGAFVIVSVTPQGRQTDIGLRAALIVLAPILVAALSFAFVWLALDWWVLRWFYRLKETAADFGAGRYAPAAMQGAPSEISELANAFDVAVADSQTRERDLADALAANISLTRELHHRVKNNLQVLASLVSRQQRRASEPLVRTALSEARARMAPVALAYRFINPPEERTLLDASAYLRELARQLHVALGGDARGITLDVNVEPGFRSADDATNIGLIVAEALITGYANASSDSQAAAVVTWAAGANGGQTLIVGVRNATPTGHERSIDRELVQEIARQLNAEVKIADPADVTLKMRPPEAPADVVAHPSADITKV